MKRLTLIPLAVLLLGVVMYFAEQPQHSKRHEGRPGPFPSDWFMQQRLWPDQTISTADYLAAYSASAQLRHSRSMNSLRGLPSGQPI